MRLFAMTASRAAGASADTTRVRLVTGLGSAFLVLLACSTQRLTESGEIPAIEVTVQPPSVSLSVGEARQLTVSVNPATTGTLLWSTSNDGVAGVSTAGLVTARAAGTARVTASVAGVSAGADVSVSAAPPAAVASVAISPSAAGVQVGGTTQLAATARDASGNVLAGRAIAWGSSNPSIASVSSTGLVSGAAVGQATISATSEGQSGSSAITVSSAPPPPPTVTGLDVTPPSASLASGETRQFAATENLSNGGTRTAAGVTWSATGGTVSSAGLYTAGTTAGSYRVVALGASGHADTASITITAPAPPPTVTALVLSPASASLLTGGTQQFTATEQLSNGTSRSASGITWSATGGTVLNGLYTAGMSAGTYRVIATGASGHADTASITVASPPSGSCVAPNLLQHGFDNQSFSPLAGTPGISIVADATARGGYSVRKDWTGGSHDGAEVWANFASTKVVYARWRFKYDSRFDVSGIFKMIRFHAPNVGTMNGTLLIQWGQFVWAWDTFEAGFRPNVGVEILPASLAGGWHWYEVMNDISVDGRPRARVWIDGQLQIDAVGNSTAATNGLSFGTIQWTGTYNSPAATATSWFDEVAISTSCIGIPVP
ncbi:MAG: Ig-like domain-containing protein [Gemmatimonadaceae bacterium]